MEQTVVRRYADYAQVSVSVNAIGHYTGSLCIIYETNLELDGTLLTDSRPPRNC